MNELTIQERFAKVCKQIEEDVLTTIKAGFQPDGFHAKVVRHYEELKAIAKEALESRQTTDAPWTRKCAKA